MYHYFLTYYQYIARKVKKHGHKIYFLEDVYLLPTFETQENLLTAV